MLHSVPSLCLSADVWRDVSTTSALDIVRKYATGCESYGAAWSSFTDENESDGNLDAWQQFSSVHHRSKHSARTRLKASVPKSRSSFFQPTDD